ncbi:hypothetical protein [Undibacterium arcticum]|uniref:hypothetical protein n=1 Tax=Undibacterium arcticum TaxID=1762892 RepID=UPI0036F21FE2
MKVANIATVIATNMFSRADARSLAPAGSVDSTTLIGSMSIFIHNILNFAIIAYPVRRPRGNTVRTRRAKHVAPNAEIGRMRYPSEQG